jgi:hypothetical protein
VTTTNSPGSDSPAAGAPTIRATQFNEHEEWSTMLARMIREQDVDMALPFDCADPRVNFAVRGWFLIPKGSGFKHVADSGA